MATEPLLFTFFLIFTSAAVLATIALYTRQPMIITYIAAGILLGPSVTGLVSDPTIISNLSTIGIIFLLFLLGLDMQPSKLANMLGNALLVGLFSSLAFFGLGFAVGFVFGYTVIESTIIGVAMMFSSTIIGIKLLAFGFKKHSKIAKKLVFLIQILANGV